MTVESSIKIQNAKKFYLDNLKEVTLCTNKPHLIARNYKTSYLSN
ncbi:hypothetical protein B0I10_101106 [Flavobacterium lacus]|uniref:Uncharacterized protein n=1 Tax=Flavobacterium lacus TaxID=1353778 RepID=A0A328X056_9FLAO|nr:hypothetical protein B0I10_101106 [Flavobacterium lacus]